MSDSPTPQPFFTSNRFLAKAIAISGLPCSVRREYDQKYLDKHKCASASEATKRGLFGYETWFFAPSAALDKIIAAFDAENDAIDALVKKDQEIPFCDHSAQEVRCQEFVRAMRGSKLLDKLLASQVPFIRIWDDGAPRTHQGANGERTVTYPGFKVLPANASDKLKKEMGL